VPDSIPVSPMDCLRVLYIDMNSFYPSVEQQLDPRLRGRPVAITAVDGGHGACVAASYEAKAHGVRTGTPVREARRLCPGIVFLPSRHRLYVRYNLKVAAVLDRFAELTNIRSVDEFQIALDGDAMHPDGLAPLVARMKAAVSDEVGSCLRFSAGAGPNHLLAKIAGKLQKPDGFRWLWSENMPGAISHLAIDDLPGISRRMKERLFRAGVFDVVSLCRLDPRHARQIWNSVEGERFVRMLQGMDIPLTQTERGGFGQSKVLGPQFRDPREAYLVSRWLVEKATMRLRRESRVSGAFSVFIAPLDGPPFKRTITCAPAQDTALFLRLNRALWRQAWRDIRHHRIISIGIHLGAVALLDARPGDFLLGIEPGRPTSGEKLGTMLDRINDRFGMGTIRYGLNRPHEGFFEKG